MRALTDETGKRRIVFLSRNDLDFLIYLSSDVWITPELKRFKNNLLERAGVRDNRKSSDSKK
jgi:hypothetical protein